jgi:hypothetical protein
MSTPINPQINLRNLCHLCDPWIPTRIFALAVGPSRRIVGQRANSLFLEENSKVLNRWPVGQTKCVSGDFFSFISPDIHERQTSMNR